MSEYDEQVQKNEKRNAKFIKEFERWLKSKKLTPKTIGKHVSNMELYLNNFLNYYEPTSMEKGIFEVFDFLDDWFIRKCLWSSKTSLKEMAASIKKFYQCMSEKNYISEEDYNHVTSIIKDNMDGFLSTLEEYDDEFFDDIW